MLNGTTIELHPKLATARRIGEVLGSIPGGGTALERWVQRPTYTVAIGDSDAHAKNVALMLRPTGTELAWTCDALSNLILEGLTSWALEFVLDGEFDHRCISAGHIAAEVHSWRVIPERRATAIVDSTITALEAAVAEVLPPKQASPGLAERMQWNVSRLAAGLEISEPEPKPGR